MVNLSNIGA